MNGWLIIIIIMIFDILLMEYACISIAEMKEGVLSDILGMEALQYNNYIKHME